MGLGLISAFLFPDDEKELSVIDIEWSRHNIQVSETDMQRENDADVSQCGACSLEKMEERCVHQLQVNKSRVSEVISYSTFSVSI